VETLLDRGAEGDMVEAESAIIRFADAPADDGLVIRDIWLLRLRTLLSRARGDETGYRDHRDRYRAMATRLHDARSMRRGRDIPARCIAVRGLVMTRRLPQRTRSDRKRLL